MNAEVTYIDRSCAEGRLLPPITNQGKCDTIKTIYPSACKQSAPHPPPSPPPGDCPLCHALIRDAAQAACRFHTGFRTESDAWDWTKSSQKLRWSNLAQQFPARHCLQACMSHHAPGILADMGHLRDDPVNRAPHDDIYRGPARHHLSMIGTVEH